MKGERVQVINRREKDSKTGRDNRGEREVSENEEREGNETVGEENVRRERWGERMGRERREKGNRGEI